MLCDNFILSKTQNLIIKEIVITFKLINNNLDIKIFLIGSKVKMSIFSSKA